MAGIIGELAALPVLWLSHALAGLEASSGLGTWLLLTLSLGYMALAGAIYGRIFMRAANDRRGGWLFGISYGFLLWMLGPGSIMPWLTGHPVLIGGAAQGLLIAHLVYGLALGALFPHVHRLVQRKAPTIAGGH